MDYQSLFSLITILLTFVGYVPYIVDIFAGKTKPHAYTWFTVALTAFVAYGLQVEGGAGVGAFPMLVITCFCVLIFVLSLWKGSTDRTLSDLLFLILSVVALVLWMYAEQSVLSVLLITCSEILGFVPTIRKSWKKPYTETFSLYSVSALRHGISILALEKINLLTALYPAAWALTNVAITSLLIIRRRQLPKEG